MYKAIRYIGSKQKVLDFLEESIFNKLSPNGVFFEGFSGTGIISQYLTETRPNLKIYGGDLSLYSEILFSIMNFSYSGLNQEIVEEFIKEFEELPLVQDGIFFNEFSQNGTPSTYQESRLFFHELAGKTIDTYRAKVIENINNGIFTQEQSRVILFYLMAYVCKMANTTSVFGAFLKSDPKYKPLDLNFFKEINSSLKLVFNSNVKKTFLLGDIVSNLKELDQKFDLIYLDPPYSTRRYESNYHILNYVADLNFSVEDIKETKTGLPKFIPSNPFGKKSETEIIFKEMILEGLNKSNCLAISYNTDGVIQQNWMEDLSKEFGFSLETKTMHYKRFKSKQVENNNELQEILWILRKE